MGQVKFSQDLGIIIKKNRLLTHNELEKYINIIPEASIEDNRMVSYLLNLENKPNSEFTEVGVLSYSDGTDVYSRIALDIDGIEIAQLQVGDEFLYDGKFYTLIDSCIAISTFFIKNAQID